MIAGLVVEERLDILDPLIALVVERRHPIGGPIERAAVTGRATRVVQVRHGGVRIDARIAEEHVVMRSTRLSGEHQRVVMAGVGLKAMRAERTASIFPVIDNVVSGDETGSGRVRGGGRMARECTDCSGHGDGSCAGPALSR